MRGGRRQFERVGTFRGTGPDHVGERVGLRVGGRAGGFQTVTS